MFEYEDFESLKKLLDTVPVVTPSFETKIAVIGKGTASLLLIPSLIRNGCDVTIYFDSNKPELGVGESTVPTVQKQLAPVGIFIESLVRKNIASYKTGVRFFDWGKSDTFDHPFNSNDLAFHFYTKDFNLIKKIKLNNIDLSNEILIDEKLLGGIKDYGTFYIYHSTKKMNTEKNIISNRCYIGYSKNNNLFSYVHGNTLVNYKKFTNEDLISENIINTSLFSNQSYRIQKFFNNFDKNELFFSNPTSKQITIYINQKRISLKKGCCILVNTYGDKIVQFRSNCLFLRPTIFSYKDEYIDVHHA